MRRSGLKLFAFLAALVTGGMADATDTGLTAVERWQADKGILFDASEVELADFMWVARPVVVFADSPVDPAFRRQMELLEAERDQLIERDVVIITDTDPSAGSSVRTKLRPRGFMLTLVGKDGGVKLRKPSPWHVRELSRQIDKMPIRLQELQDARDRAAGR